MIAAITLEYILFKLIVPGILGLVGTGGGIFLVRHTTKKVDAETANIIINSAEQIVSIQSKAFERIDRESAELRSEIEQLKAKLDAVTSDNITLRSEIVSLREESTNKTAQILSLQNHMVILEDVVRSLGGTIPPRPSNLQNFFTNKK